MTGQHWPRPRWNTRTTPARRSTSATSSPPIRRRLRRHSPTRGLHHHLDHDTLDAARVVAVAFIPISSTWLWKPLPIMLRPVCTDVRSTSLPPLCEQVAQPASSPHQETPVSKAPFLTRHVSASLLERSIMAFWNLRHRRYRHCAVQPPLPRRRRLLYRQRYGLEPTCRVDAGGHIHVDPAAWHLASRCLRRMNVWKANPSSSHVGRARALLAARSWSTLIPTAALHHPVIFRARAVVHFS